MKLKFFKLCKKLAEKSDHAKHKLGCCITKRGKVLSIGVNRNKTSPRSTHNYKHIHAENDAITSANKKDLIGAVAYIYRETKSGITAMARPCPTCLQALKKCGLKKIYYTINGGFKEEYL